MTPAETTRLLAMMRGYWPRQAVTEEVVMAYSEMLADLSWAAASMAVKELAATSQWWPAISEIRGVVARLQVSPATSGDAWAEVCQAVRNVGRYKVPEWSSPAVERAVDAVGGWQVICDSEMLAAERKCFLAAYEAATQRELHEVQVRGVLPAPEERRRIARGEARPVGDLLRLPGGGDK